MYRGVIYHQLKDFLDALHRLKTYDETSVFYFYRTEIILRGGGQFPHITQITFSLR